MKCLVTGAAGFIGSHLCERLLARGDEVIGLDAFIPFYPRTVKAMNLTRAFGHPRFILVERDLRKDPLEDVLEDVDAVFHLAALPGLMDGPGSAELYAQCNPFATQRLLAALRPESLRRFVHISTSSVYGYAAVGDEMLPVEPVSLYGASKLAAENLCRRYAERYGMPLVILRYFSVYGPRQRSDMGIYRFIRSMLRDEPILIYGDGMQSRGNTYIDDCIDATVRSLEAPVGEIYNVGGTETANVWEIVARLEAIMDRPALIQRGPARNGDQRCTAADTRKIWRDLGWKPRVSLNEGLRRQVDWQGQLLPALVAATDLPVDLAISVG
jgi:nucleoside-diphosphate-sugar epimerase